VATHVTVRVSSTDQ